MGIADLVWTAVGVRRHSYRAADRDLLAERRAAALALPLKLAQVLPELVSDLEIALVNVGRGDLVRQMKDATLAHWSYDDFSDTTYLQLSEAPTDMMNVERLSLYDELGVNVDTDASGRLCGIEILQGKRIASRLDEAPAG